MGSSNDASTEAAKGVEDDCGDGDGDGASRAAGADAEGEAAPEASAQGVRRRKSTREESRDEANDEDGEEEDEDGKDGNDDGKSSSGDDLDDDVNWEEHYTCPLTVRFTQDKIHPFFYRRGPITNCVPKIRVAHAMREVPASSTGRTRAPADSDADTGLASTDCLELLPPFGSIHCLRKGEHLWSLDNRRLYALQLAAMQWWPQRCCVKVLTSDRLPRRKFKSQYRKFQTQSEGRSIQVTARYQVFDSWSWFDRAVELEWSTLSQRCGVLLSAFEILPIIGALLFRTGITGLASRTPFLVGFLMTFIIDLARQKVPVFERRICELHVKSVMEGEAQTWVWPCCGGRAQQGHRHAAAAAADHSVMSLPVMAGIMVLFLALSLPYVLSIKFAKVRSSMLSCWLGVACVLAMQLMNTFRDGAAVEHEYSGQSQTLTPKHRD